MSVIVRENVFFEFSKKTFSRTMTDIYVVSLDVCDPLPRNIVGPPTLKDYYAMFIELIS